MPAWADYFRKIIVLGFSANLYDFRDHT